MSRLRELLSRIRGMFLTDSLDRDLEDEMRLHLEMIVEENIARGMSSEDAWRNARRSFGGVLQTTEACRDQRGLPFMETLMQDVRYGFRMLRKSPGFTAVAVITLALGIGANSAIFNVLDAVMLKSLPVADPQQLLLVTWTASGWPSIVEDLEGTNYKDPHTGQWLSESVPYPAFQTLRTDNTTFSEVFAFASNVDGVNAQFDGRAHAVSSEAVSGNYFSGLGVQTIIGRPILSSDDEPAAAPVTVLSYGCWKSKLGGDESAVGKTIVLNSIPLTVVGVAPPEFFGTQPGENIDVWVPLSAYTRLVRSLNFAGPAQWGATEAEAATAEYFQKPSTWWLVVMGRLKQGVSEQQAVAELNVIFDQSIDAMITSEKQQANRPALRVAPGNKGLDALRRQFSEPLFVLMCAVALVLLIACANVAGLLLSRASARRKEIAVRLSLGARRLQLIQQLVTESLLLALIGGAFGLLLSRWVSELLVALVGSGRQSIAIPLNVNVRVLTFTAVISVLAGVVFGLAPAFSATRISLTEALKEGGAGRGLGGRRSVFAKTLVSAQVALSMVLLVGAGLFLRTLQKLESVPIGFERRHLLLFSISPGLNGYQGPGLAEYYRQVQDRIATIPGVVSSTFSTHAPVGGGSSSSNIKIPGVTTDKKGFELHRHLVGPDYFKTLGIPVLTGRVLDERDNASAPLVAVVNQTLALNAFGEENPLGKILRFGSDAKPRDFQIVGVVGDAKYNDLRQPPPPTAYLAHFQALDAASFMTFQVRTSGDPTAIVPSLRDQLAQVDKNVPIGEIDTLEERIDKALLLERMFSRLTGSFAGLALVLVCVGLYGTMSYFVARRTNEIGIRMALGARPARVFGMVLVEGLTLTGAGLAAGLAAAAFGTRLIASSLYDVASVDPMTFSSVAVLVIGVGLLACYVPARRAMKVDPMVALRYE